LSLSVSLVFLETPSGHSGGQAVLSDHTYTHSCTTGHAPGRMTRRKQGMSHSPATNLQYTHTHTIIWIRTSYIPSTVIFIGLWIYWGFSWRVPINRIW